MKVETKKLKDKQAEILIKDTAPYFVNSIRRTLMADLPKLAVEDVVIYDNTSPLFDEIIAHRLGMLPIPTDLGVLNFRDECSCDGEGCPNCTIRYTLSKEGEGTVYSGDLESENKSWKITEDKIPIVELYGDQRLILEVEAILGTGKQHAKWQPVQSPGYKLLPELEINEEKIDEIKDFIEQLPGGIVELKKNKLELLDVDKLPVLESYIDKENFEYIEINRNEKNILFRFETDGSLDAKTALYESAEILEKKYGELKEKIKELE